MAAMLGWSPSEFWRATWHDFESALWTTARQNAPREKRDSNTIDATNPSAVNGLFASLAARASP